jgi:hypothetical protein
MQIEDIIDKLHGQRLTHPTPKAMEDARGHESREACCPGGANEAGEELYNSSALAPPITVYHQEAYRRHRQERHNPSAEFQIHRDQNQRA